MNKELNMNILHLLQCINVSTFKNYRYNSTKHWWCHTVKIYVYLWWLKIDNFPIKLVFMIWLTLNDFLLLGSFSLADSFGRTSVLCFLLYLKIGRLLWPLSPAAVTCSCCCSCLARCSGLSTPFCTATLWSSICLLTHL